MSFQPSRRHRAPLSLLRLEDRTLPASVITISVGANGTGSLDNLLFDATPGVIATTDGGSAPATLSTGALAAVDAGTSISVSALNGINFNDLGGALTLQTGPGNGVSFSSGLGAISVANQNNTLATNGGSLTFTAGTNLGTFNLNAAGGNLTLTAGAADAGNLSTNDVLTSGTGAIVLRATNAAGGSISHSGSAVGQSISVSAHGNVVVGALQGSLEDRVALVGRDRAARARAEPDQR